MTTISELRQNDVIYKFIQGLHSFILNWTLVKRKKKCKNHFDKQENPGTYLKLFPKESKNFKANWSVLGQSKAKILLSVNHGSQYFFETLASSNIFVALWPRVGCLVS